MEAKNVNPSSQPSDVVKDESRTSEATAPLTKETASDLPATSNEVSPTLEEALEKIRDLYRQEQVAKWGQGDQVNLIEAAHLAFKKGYKETRECLKKELPDLQDKTLYTYAFVAKHFSQEHAKKCGVWKLQRLVALHDMARLPAQGDPADLEVQIPQKDGSLVAKKFSDCTLRDLQSASKHRKQERKSAGRVVREAPSKADDAPKLPSPVLWRPVAMIVLGGALGFLADLLLPSILGSVVSILAVVLTLGGFADLTRYLVSIRERMIAAFKSGHGLRTLKEQGMDVLRNGRKLLAALKSVDPKDTPTSTQEQTPPPSDKQAA